MQNTTELVLKKLEDITGTDQVRQDLDMELFTEKMLDSFGTVELIVALSEELGIELTPGQVNRETWATPRKIIRDIDARLGK